MTSAVLIVALGFFLGVRHATDADHVIAMTTIVTRQRRLGQAALTGLLWGVGHTVTIVAVGSAIILFNVSVSDRLGALMELSVGGMLILLGALNLRRRRHGHVHGDQEAGADAAAAADGGDRQWLDGGAGRRMLYPYVRPLVIGIVHGLAGSAAIALLILATIHDTVWAVAYLVVFGIGTIAGMMLITMSLASAFRYAGHASPAFNRGLTVASGVLSLAFGLWVAYHQSAAAGLLPTP